MAAPVVYTAEEVAHASRNVTNLLPFSIPEGSRCRLIPVLSGLQECNYVMLQYKYVMTRAQPPLFILLMLHEYLINTYLKIAIFNEKRGIFEKVQIINERN